METPKRLPILRNVQELLFRNSGERCAFPKCNKPIVVENRLKGEMCHIEAAMPGGERFNAEMTNEGRRSYENLILLCFDHHEETNNEEIYTVGFLKEMKKAHESNIAKLHALNEDLIDLSNTENNPIPQIDTDRVSQAIDLFIRHEQFLELEKTEYSEPPDYIQRSIYSISETRQEVKRESKAHDLKEIIKTKRRITVLGIAGSGKSIELDHLAFHYSKPNSPFYPVKIRLNKFNREDGIERLLELKFPQYRIYKDQQLLIILDALDEVSPENLHEAIKQIENLPDKLPRSRVVVSCRNNFYSVETLEHRARISNFETYRLNPLTSSDILNYCQQKLGNQSHVFIDSCSNKGQLIDQLKSPFYLVQLVNFYQEKGELPDSKTEIFQFLIEWRIQYDIVEKYRNQGLRLEESQDTIKKCIRKLATAAELLQRNFLLDREFRLLVSENNLQSLIEHTFLFDKNEDGSWEFHHNNFQEYLAAECLSHFPFHRIKRFIAYEPKYKKVKPSWVNTLSFLFGILAFQRARKFKQVLAWLISIEPDLLVGFEKDNIDLKAREKIFKKIYSDYEKKKIIIRSEKFNLNELAEFVSDSDLITKFLIKKARRSKEVWKKVEALKILPYLESVESFKHEIEAIIVTLLSRETIEDHYKLDLFYTLRHSNIYSEELTKRILEITNLESSQYLRAGLYTYLTNAEDSEDFADIIIDGLKHIGEPKVLLRPDDDDSKEPVLADEKYNLERLVEKFNSQPLLKKLLQWGHRLDDSRYNNYHIDLLGKVLINVTKLPDGGIDLYDDVFALLVTLARRYSRELSESFNKYFTNNKTSLKAFDQLRKLSENLESSSDIDFHYAMAAVADSSCIDALLNDYKNGKLSEDMAFRFRNFLGGERGDLHDYYLEEINKLSDNRFAYSTRDFESERKEKLKSDISLLLEMDKFRKSLEEIFDTLGSDTLTADELWDYRKEVLNDDLTKNNIVLSTLREEAKKFGNVTKESLDRIFNEDESWYWFQIHRIIDIDKNNEGFEFDDKGIEFLTEWLTDGLKRADFRTAIYLNDHGNIRQRYLEHFIPYIAHRLDFDLEEKVYLDFLWLIPGTIPQKTTSKLSIDMSETENGEMDSTPSNLNDYVVNKTSIEKASKQVLENMRSGQLLDYHQKYNHCKFCAKYDIEEGAELIEELLEDTEHEYNNESLVRWYFDLSNDQSFIKERIDSFDEETRFIAVEGFLSANDPIGESYCVSKIRGLDDDDRKFRYISLLSEYNTDSAFSLYKEWILKNKRIPDHIFDRKIPLSEDVNDYFEIYNDSLENDYGGGTWNNRNIYLERMIELGTADDTTFKLVKHQLERWIRKYDRLKFLHYHINNLELAYYTRKSQELTMHEVNDLLRDDYSRSSFINDFIEIKPNFAGIGLNINKLIEFFRNKNRD